MLSVQKKVELLDFHKLGNYHLSGLNCRTNKQVSGTFNLETPGSVWIDAFCALRAEVSDYISGSGRVRSTKEKIKVKQKLQEKISFLMSV